MPEPPHNPVVDLEQLRQLAELMAEHGLNELAIRQGDTTIRLRRGPAAQVVTWAPPLPVPSAPLAASVPGEPAAPADRGLVPITSPMVGTFYSAHDPESAPFVHVGSEIEPGTTVCVIEAMKVFNEIKAELAGTVERILVQDEQAVEYGQPLMLVRPKT